MEIGDTFEKYLGYHYAGKIIEKDTNRHVFRVVDIVQNVNRKKDLLICVEVDYGYKECFHRMDVEEVERSDK